MECEDILTTGDKVIVKAFKYDYPTAFLFIYFVEERRIGTCNSVTTTKCALQDVLDVTGITRGLYKKAAIKLVDSGMFDIRPLLKTKEINVTIKNRHQITNILNGALFKENVDNVTKDVGVHIPELISYWNKLPLVTKHNKKSNVWSRVQKYTKALQKGVFGLEYTLVNSVSYELQTKQWELPQLYNCLDLLALLYREDYQPLNKKWLKGLADLMYNPRTQRSVLLDVWLNPPQLLVQKQITQLDKTERNIFDLLKTFIVKYDLLVSDSKLLTATNKLYAFYNKVFDNTVNLHYDLHMLFITVEVFIKIYFNFLESRKKLYSGMIGLNGNTAIMFMHYLSEKSYGDSSRVLFLQGFL